MEKISVCMVVYNEEKLIRRCLDSFFDVVDEIILVHDGECNDKTLEIAKEYGAKIFVLPHVGVAEEHRPFSFKQATNNWLFIIDADEFLSKELHDNLKFLVSNKEGVVAYELLWPLWDGEKEIDVSWPYKKMSLLNKRATSLLGMVHSEPQVIGKVERINFKLKHQPEYNNFSRDSFIRKQLPWARLQASYYLRDFSEIQKFNWSGSDWPKLIEYRRKFPLLLLPFEFVWTFFKIIFGGAYKAGSMGFKNALTMSCYRASVNYYIYKLKYKHI